MFEAQYHPLQGLSINSAASYPVKVKFFALAIGACPFQQSKLTGVPSAAWAVIGARTAQKLVPAFFAQIIITLANAFAAIDTNCRPKKLV